MPILENLRKALGFDTEMTDDHDMELPWEEDFSPLGGEAQVPDASSLNMPRLVDALRRLFWALDDETRKAVSDGELPSAPAFVEEPQAPATVQNTGDAHEVKELRAQYDREQSRRQDAENKVVALQNRIADLEKQLSAASAEKVTRVEAPKSLGRAKLEEEVQRLRTLNEQLTTKSKMSDRMLSDMQGSLAEKRKEAEALAQENTALKEQLQALSETATPDAEELKQKLEAAEKRIDELTVANSALKQERKELKETIESNLYNQAHTENQLRRRIKQLEGSKSNKRGRGKTEKNTRETTQPKKSTLDKAIDATNWIDGAEEKPVDKDFGYQDPDRKAPLDPDEQLFLF